MTRIGARSHAPALVLSLVASALFTIPAEAADAAEPAAQGGLMLAREDGSCCELAPSMGTAAHLVVTGALVRGEVTQVFVNPTDRTLEAVYLFPLLDGAAVHGFRMRIGDRIVEGRVEEKQAARATYEEAAAEGRRASLLEHGSPDLFRLSVANLGPGELVEVTLEYQHEVTYRDGRFRLRFPTVAPPRYGQDPELAPPVLPAGPPGDGGAAGNPVGLRVDLAPGFPVVGIASPTHALRVDDLPGGRHRVVLADALVPADGNFVLEWRPAAGGRLPTSVAVEETADGTYVLALLVPPGLERREATVSREVVFVLDTSGSMADGGALAQAASTVLAALERLEPADRFNVVRFSDEAQALFTASRPAEESALAEARAFVSGLEADGGTEILPALELALSDARGPWHTLRQVVFLTDGRVEDLGPFLSTLQMRTGETRLFTVGIGPAPSSHFMRRAAEIGRGTATFIDDPSRVGEDMTGLLRKLEGPVLLDVTIDWGAAAAEAHPDPVPDLYAGEPLVLVARTDTRPERLVVSGTGAAGPWRAEVPLPAGPDTAGVARLWAERRVEALEADRLAGADASMIRDRIVRVALAYGLTTEHTSLVAVDTTPGPAPGTGPAETWAVPAGPVRPAPPPAVTAYHGAPIEEVITLTSEAPLLDERRVSRGASIAQIELEELPWPGSAWSLTTRSAGALAGPAGLAGVGGHRQPEPESRTGDAGGDPTVLLDGLDVTSVVRSEGLSLVDFAFQPLETFEVVATGPDTELVAVGPTLDLVTPRGSNRSRGSARAAWSDGELRSHDPIGDPLGDEAGEGAADAGGLDGLASIDAEVGGPIVRDHFWAWAGGGGSRIDHTAPGGDRGSSSLDQAAVKVNAQPTSASSLMIAGRGSELESTAVGAGPDRAPEATLEEDASSLATQIQATYVFTSDLYLTGRAGSVRRDEEAVPEAVAGLGSEGDAVPDWLRDAAGVVQGSAFDRSSDESRRSWESEGAWYAELGGRSHELAFGASREDAEAEVVRRAPGRGLAVAAGTLYQAPGPGDVLAVRRDGRVGSRTRRHAVWIDDTIDLGRLTAQVGLRADAEEVATTGGAVPGNPFDPRLAPATAAGAEVAADETLSPRLGLAWVLGAHRDHLFRASVSRFAGRLDHAVAAHAHPLRPAVTYSLFGDADGDLVADPGELPGAVPVTVDGIDPRTGAPAGAVAGDLSPELTDETVLGYEWAIAPSAVVGLTAVWRRTTDVWEERLLVRDPATGEAAAATADDWVPAGAVSGTLPDGTPYDSPWFDLRPGLEWTGGGLLVNGSREREALDLTLHWTRRFQGRWTSRGHVTWSDTSWRVPARFARFDDPTPAVGGGDRDGQPVVTGPTESLTPAGSRWSFYAGAYYRLPRGFEIAGSVSGREGLPVVYRRSVLRPGAGPVDVAVTPSPDARRTDDLATFDARIAKELEVAGGRLEVALEGFNLLDDRTVTAREDDLGATRGGLPNDVFSARTLRLGVRLSWR